MRIETHGDLQVQYLDLDGAAISTSEDTSDLIGNAWMDHAEVIAVPVARLDPAFFDLSSLIAGEIAQKVVNYHLRLAVIGDVTGFAVAGSAFESFVVESNRGDHIWFLESEEALAAKLNARLR
jgi:hypothetical protein